MSRFFQLPFLFSLLAITACDSAETQSSSANGGTGGSGGGTASGGATGGGGSGGGSFEVALDWKPCPLDSKKASGSDAECADVAVPADWDAPAGPTIQLFVKRWPVLETPAPHHFWLVQGGPGSASVEWDGRVKRLGMDLPEAQFYFLDPRGTGRSTRLGCPTQEDPQSDGGISVTLAEWPACLDAVKAAHGDLLPYFTTTQTARDLGALVQAASGAAAKRSVMGQSYGTTLVQRWLHFFPDLASSVILDSLANPGTTFDDFTEQSDRVGHDYLDLCAADPACSGKLGPDPGKTADEAFAAAFETGACPALTQAGLDRAGLARALYTMLTFVEYRAMIPPVLHRLARCNAEDVAALTFLKAQLTPGATADLAETLFGEVLYHHIVLSEMWDGSLGSPAEHLAALQSVEFGLISVDLDTLRPTWPVYGGDPLAAAYPVTEVPLLMANGTLDAQTPLVTALLAKDHYTGASQHFLVVPGAPHGALGGEPWSKPSAPCSVQITLGFLADPSAPIAEDCFALADPVAFEPTGAISQLFLDTADPWGDGPPPPPPLSGAELQLRRAELRERIVHLRHGFR